MVSFSVVVPVYNVQDCLARCVESLVNQDYPKEQLQVILVDDGSTDESGALCDTLATGHSFVEVYHKPNGGLSDARNYGFERATGEYVIFLDSDDYLSLDSCAKFAESIEKAERPDVVSGTTLKHIDDHEKRIVRNSVNQPVMTGKQFLEKELSGSFFVAAWGSIYKRSFLMENELSFWKGILHEDEDFTIRALLAAKTVLSTDIAFYHYVIRANSITTKKDRTKNAISIFEICKKLTPIAEQLPESDLKKLLKTHLAKIMYKAICDAKLFLKDKRYIIDYKLLKQNSVYSAEKFRYRIARISPKLLYSITTLRRR